MALETQVVSLPFTQGLDSKTNKHLSAKPPLVQDVVFVGGTLEKRPGTEPLPNTMDTAGSFGSGDALFAQGAELVRIDGNTTYGLAQATSTWTTKSGGGNYATVATQRIQRNTRVQSNADQASVNGVTVFAWLETAAPQAGLHVATLDEASGTFYLTGSAAARATADTLSATRCVVVGNRVVILHADVTDGKIYSAYVDTTAPATLSAFTAIKTDLWTSAAAGGITIVRMDACAYSSTAGLCVYMGAANTDFTAFFFDSAGAVTLSATFNAQVTAGLFLNINCQKDTAGNVYFFWAESPVPDVYFHSATSLLNTITAKTSIGIGIGVQATCVESPANTITYVASGQGAEMGMRKATVTSVGVSSDLANVTGLYGLGLVTDAFVWNGVAVVGVGNAPKTSGGLNTQPTMWVCDLAGNPVARFLSGLSGASIVKATGSRLSRPILLPSGATGFLAYERGQIAYDGATSTINTTTTGLTRADVLPVKPMALPVVSINGVAHIGGALPRCYDGQQVVEDGIPVPPLQLTLSTTTGAGGLLSSGQYQMVALWSWVDAQGQLVRSAVSPPLTWTATATDAQALTWTTLPLSSRDKLPAGFTVQVEFYRTEANGQLFYRDSSVSAPAYNATGTNSYSTTQADSTLIAGELLYTTGGVNDWLSPPPYRCSCAHKDRLIVAGLESPYAWASSSQSIATQALRFNENWGGRVPAETGPITAVASMDGNLIIFTTLAAYAVQGDGPDLLGNNNWPPPQRITSVDAGAVSWQSVVSTNAGILYQSSRGFSLLDRGLGSPPEFGSEVQRYSGWTVRCGTVVPASQQVRYQVDLGAGAVGQLQGTMMTSPGGLCLVYDYFYGQWSVFSNYDGQSACLYQGKYTRAKSSGAIRQERPGTWGDAGYTYYPYTPSTVETPWIKVGDIQGFQRAKRILLLGTYGSPCTITWEAAYNYVEEYTDSVTFTGDNVLTSGGPLQIRWKPSVQKCEAVKFRMADSNISGSGKGMALTGLSLEVGVKRGPFRLPASQSL